MCVCIICIYVVCVCRYVYCMFIVWFLYAMYNIDVRLEIFNSYIYVPVGSGCIYNYVIILHAL